MKRLVLAILLATASSAQAATIDLKLDDQWLVKLGRLCQAAIYGSRMDAEPICAELNTLVQQAQVAERNKDAKDKPSTPPQTPTPAPSPEGK